MDAAAAVDDSSSTIGPGSTTGPGPGPGPSTIGPGPGSTTGPGPGPGPSTTGPGVVDVGFSDGPGYRAADGAAAGGGAPPFPPPVDAADISGGEIARAPPLQVGEPPTLASDKAILTKMTSEHIAGNAQIVRDLLVDEGVLDAGFTAQLVLARYAELCTQYYALEEACG